jgi:hypothetical protein
LVDTIDLKSVSFLEYWFDSGSEYISFKVLGY